ncbi:MAG: helix-hairpin-helix domain-containing protein, partial [Sediminibacterium sp.]|nr:helix-hairpin-helix domain-containing protein [Sediminibacterium sp.]
MKKFIKDYLQFTKKERIGLGVLLLFMGLFLYFPRLIKPNSQPLQHSDTAWLNGLNYMDSGKNQPFQTPDFNSTKTKPAYFYFDPNTATELQLLTLGLTPKNVQTILNYRNKGGQFRLPEDFFKIWGIKTAVAKALIPFIRIALPK